MLHFPVLFLAQNAFADAWLCPRSTLLQELTVNTSWWKGAYCYFPIKPTFSPSAFWVPVRSSQLQFVQGGPKNGYPVLFLG